MLNIKQPRSGVTENLLAQIKLVKKLVPPTTVIVRKIKIKLRTTFI